MKTYLLVIAFCFCSLQNSYPQEDNTAIALNLPVRNSLTFNRYNINPTFSFVREQHKYISIFNKREWVQFDDAPLTYLASYTGRLAENIGAGVGVFQQNNGILTKFGGVVNFAYNARLASESNLTFGLNVGAYKNGINSGRLARSADDPALQNVPENFMFTINPGINYGIAFFDFGVAVNNLVVYDLQNSTLMQDSPEQGIQTHIMYTGYMNSQGFLDESKFSGLVRSEFRKDDTVISGIAMLTVPKGIWAQVGYNTLYGVSGGLGLNITAQIAIEYNFEKAVGDFTQFGPSHDVTLAFRLKNNQKFDYSSGDDVVGLISGSSIKKKHPATKISKEKAEENKRLAAERRLRIQAERELEQQANTEAQQLAEQKEKEEAEALAKQQAKEEAEAQAQLLAEQKAREEAETQAKLLAEQKAKEEAEAQAKRLAEQKAKEEAEAQAKLLAEQKAREEAEAQAKLLAEQKAKEEAEAQAKLLDEQKAKEEAEAQAKLLAEQQAQEEAELQAQRLAEQQEQENKAKLEEEQNRINDMIANPQDETSKAMYALAQQAEQSKTKQDKLLQEFDAIVDIKDQDLKDLKQENDLSEQGIAIAPKPFKSLSEENNRLKATIAELDKAITLRNQQIEDLKNLYKDKYEDEEEIGTIYLDEVYVYYKKTLNRLTAEQIEATQAKIALQLRLDEINVATEFERNRRIKRALYDNEEQRYANDRAALQSIKSTTPMGQVFTIDDFDFGEEQSGNIQILKNVENVRNGFYLIIAVHNDIQKRNDFVTKVYASGRADVDFFYDVNTSKYYIYYDKFNSIEQANEALKSKGSKPYNTKMTLVKIEN